MSVVCLYLNYLFFSLNVAMIIFFQICIMPDIIVSLHLITVWVQLSINGHCLTIYWKKVQRWCGAVSEGCQCLLDAWGHKFDIVKEKLPVRGLMGMDTWSGSLPPCVFSLSHTLPNFKAKIVSHLLANKQQHGHMLFLLLEQCFKEVGLTERKNVVSACCSNKKSKTYKNLLEW